MAEFDPSVEYRDIQGWIGYKVGDDGSVWTCKKLVRNKTGYGCHGELGDKWRRLKVTTGRTGYSVVGLHGGGRRCQASVHRLVLEAFRGPRPPGMVGCHYPDPTKSNNNLSNLRWDTHAANSADAKEHGTYAFGERCGHSGGSSLDDEIVMCIRRDYASDGRGIPWLSKKYNRPTTTIHSIVVGRTWKHLPLLKKGGKNAIHTTIRTSDIESV